MTKLKHPTLAAVTLGVAALAGGAFASTAPAQLISGVYTAQDRPMLLKAQFYWGGRHFCFYENGWNGPGFYWCGYAWRHGWGWGGPVGWHGWGRGYGHRGYYRGGWNNYYHTGHGNYRGGNHHGGGWNRGSVGHGGHPHS